MVAPHPYPRRRLVVFLGAGPFRTDDGIEALPVAAFLRTLESRTL